MKRIEKLLVVLLFCWASQAFAEEGKGFYLKGILGYGQGGEDLPTFWEVANTGEPITLSGGGGLNIGGALGCRINPSMSVEVGASYQSSGFNKNVSNVDGSFKRIPVTALCIYNLPTKERYRFYLGGGIGYWLSPEVSCSGLGISYDYSYESSLGFLGLAGCEWKHNEKLSWLLEARYSSVSFDFKEGTLNGIRVGAGTAYKEIDSNSIELIIGITIPFSTK